MKVRYSTIFIVALVLLGLAYFVPHLSDSILTNASVESNAIRLSVTPNRSPNAEGWFDGPVTVTAQANDPDVVITYSLNGGEVVEGGSVLIAEPGRHELSWAACKGERCHEGFEQAIKIALPGNLRQLSYDPDRREWSFTGLVTEVREATLLGQPGQVAWVQGQDFSTWVVLQAHRLELADEDIKPGDQVRVWIAGRHVGLNEVDWTQCSSREFDAEVSNYEYCSMGTVLDDGLFGEDAGYKLSPSNQLIRDGRTAARWQTGVLFWNTSLVIPGVSAER